jgi:hypothetical protein
MNLSEYLSGFDLSGARNTRTHFSSHTETVDAIACMHNLKVKIAEKMAAEKAEKAEKKKTSWVRRLFKGEK